MAVLLCKKMKENKLLSHFSSVCVTSDYNIFAVNCKRSSCSSLFYNRSYFLLRRFKLGFPFLENKPMTILQIMKLLHHSQGYNQYTFIQKYRTSGLNRHWSTMWALKRNREHVTTPLGLSWSAARVVMAKRAEGNTGGGGLRHSLSAPRDVDPTGPVTPPQQWGALPCFKLPLFQQGPFSVLCSGHSSCSCTLSSNSNTGP